MKTIGLVCTFIILTSFYPFRPGEYGLRKVVVDAGHGGKDPGAIGVGGMREKDVTLDIALEVGNRIKAEFPEVQVIFTRSTDVFIELHDRARRANEANADLFLSIHADAAASSQAHGTETFALGLHRSKENLETAKRENQVILMEDNYDVQYQGFDPSSDESYIAITLQQSAHLDQSLSIASKIQDQFTAIGRRNRGVKQAGFIVLYKTTMPSVLIETGFITNSTEGKFLSQKENRVAMSNCIINAFRDYKKEVDTKSGAGKKTVTKEVVAPKTEKETTVKSSPKEDVKKAEVEKPKVADSGVRFRVQIVSSPSQIEITPTNFKGLTSVQELKVGDSYKYTAGDELTFEDGVNLQAEVRKKGYKDAFLIAVYKEERIPVSRAKEIMKNVN
ncbi:MAG: N-acetylmuramoyl-L-alanine amidase [Flavobacteriales bacterium]|nr:N-acetylmuramoyl-L-alanine amidase [Flavobacteriales bacterium]